MQTIDDIVFSSFSLLPNRHGRRTGTTWTTSFSSHSFSSLILSARLLPNAIKTVQVCPSANNNINRFCSKNSTRRDYYALVRLTECLLAILCLYLYENVSHYCLRINRGLPHGQYSENGAQWKYSPKSVEIVGLFMKYLYVQLSINTHLSRICENPSLNNTP